MHDPEAEARRWLAAAGEELAWARYAARYPNGLESGTPGEAFSLSQAQRAIQHATAILEVATQAVDRS